MQHEQTTYQPHPATEEAFSTAPLTCTIAHGAHAVPVALRPVVGGHATAGTLSTTSTLDAARVHRLENEDRGGA